MKFRTGKIVNGVKEEGKTVEYDCWFDAISAVLAKAGMFLYEVGRDGNEVE